MTKKEILIQYREIVISIGMLEKQIEFLDKWIGGPKPIHSPQINGMPRGTNNSEAAMVQQKEDDPVLEVRLKQAELQTYTDEFNNILFNIKDIKTQNIVRGYYGLGYTDARIAREEDLSAQRVNQIRHEFINNLR